MNRFEGRTTLITGAVGGLGGATCQRIAEEGGTLIVTDIAVEDCRAFIDTLPHPERHIPVRLDVADPADWQTIADWIASKGIALHALINNAGIGSLAAVTDETVETWDKVIGIDQTGVWLGMKIIGPLVQGENPGGSIVNVCSIMGTVGGTGDNIAYHAAKGAVRTMTKSAALHWIRDGIRVNSIHPGYVATPNLVRRHGQTERYARMVADSPMGRLAEPSEVAAAIAFLASRDSSYMSGSELYVDGAYTAR